MSFLDDLIQNNTLHHFYLIKTRRCNMETARRYFSENLDCDFEIIEFNYDNLLIDDAKHILNMANRKIASNKKNFFFIKTNFINFQAQNSLLKNLEEPTAGLHFFFILPDLNNILETVFSRALVINDYDFLKPSDSDCADKKRGENSLAENPLADFWPMELADKMAFVEKLVNQIKDGQKTKRDAADLADLIIKKLNEDLAFKKENYQKIRQLVAARDFITDNGSSVKSLLEFLILALPKK